MFEIKNHIKNTRGDTLVEVLISIALVGLVIAGSYAMASSSLSDGVSATEHSQAIKLAESQVEALKSRSKDSQTRINDIWKPDFDIRGTAIPVGKDNFCLDTEATSMLDGSGAVSANWRPQYNYYGTTFNGENLIKGTSTQANTYNPVCTDDRTAAFPKYFVNIKMIPYADKSPTYLVTVKWTPAGNAPTSQTQLYYRLSGEPSPLPPPPPPGPPPPPTTPPPAGTPTVTLTANPNPVNRGALLTLNWTSTGAQSCTASNTSFNAGFMGTLGQLNGNAGVRIASGTSFTITCTNPSGSASQSVTVPVCRPGPGGTTICS